MDNPKKEELMGSIVETKDLLTMDFPDSDPWWGDTLFAKEQKLLLTGAAGVGKTFFALNLAGALEKDEPFIGEEVYPKGNKILYIDAEVQLSKMKERIINISKKYDMSHVHFFNCQSNWGISLIEVDHVDAICDIVNENGYNIVILDCLAEFHNGDENSEHDIKTVCDSIDYIIKKTGCSIILVHHTGRSGHHPRGSSYLDGWCETWINVSKYKDSFGLYVNKSRNSETFHRTGIEFTNNFIYDWKPKEPTKQDIVDQLFLENRETTNDDISKKFKELGIDVSRQYVRKMKQRSLQNLGIKGLTEINEPVTCEEKDDIRDSIQILDNKQLMEVETVPYISKK